MHVQRGTRRRKIESLEGKSQKKKKRGRDKGGLGGTGVEKKSGLKRFVDLSSSLTLGEKWKIEVGERDGRSDQKQSSEKKRDIEDLDAEGINDARPIRIGQNLSLQFCQKFERRMKDNNGRVPDGEKRKRSNNESDG